MSKKTITFSVVKINRKIYKVRVLLLLLFLLMFIIIAIFFSEEPSKNEQRIRALVFFVIIGAIIYFRFIKKPYKKVATIIFHDDRLEFFDRKIYLHEIETIEFHYEGYRGDFPSAGFYGIGAFDMTDGCNNRIIINKKNGEIVSLNFFSDKKIDYTNLTKIKSDYERNNTTVHVIKKERVLKKKNA